MEMTDKELLVLAAKAACLGSLSWDNGRLRVEPGTSFTGHNPDFYYWNPLTDDGDALRLAVALNMNVEIPGSDFVYACADCGNCSEQVRHGDKLVAARRAIVRAAAELERAARNG